MMFNTPSRSKFYRRIGSAAVLAAAMLAVGCSSDTTSTPSATSTPSTTTPSQAKAELRTDMRKLWEEHVQWTRMVIVSFAGGLPDFDSAVARLLRNQDDIGNAIKPFYGEDGGKQLTALLRDHILIAADVLKAAKSGDATAFDAQRQRWYANGDQIADFLSTANPSHWPNDAMRTAMRGHLDTTLAEAAARLGGKWDEDITSYDEARAHILMMADTLTDGIAAQFPDRFGTGEATASHH